MAHEATDSNFSKEVLEENTHVLVDFWAEWCGPCRQLAPLVDDLSKEMGDKLKVYKLNIDRNPETPQSYGIRGIPTLIIFKGGKPVSTKVGSMSKSALTEWVNSVVS